MRLSAPGIIMFLCLGCAHADSEPSLDFGMASQPTIGSMDCQQASAVLSSACPHVIDVPGYEGRRTDYDVSAYRVLRLMANEQMHERFRFLKPYNPHSERNVPRGVFVNLVMSYPGTVLYVDLQNQDIYLKLFSGAVRPFNDDAPYAVARLSWRW